MAVDGIRIAIACEDQAHRAMVTFLADRVVLAEAAVRGATWPDAETLQWARTFCGLVADDAQPESSRFYHLTRIEGDAAALEHRPAIGKRPIRDRGFIGGRPLEPEARMWRRLLLIFAAEQPRPDVLIVVRDTDGDPRRLRGLSQALELMSEFPEPWPVIAAIPHQDAEAWFVAGFVPRDEVESERLRQLRKDLSFSPPDEPHRLTAHPNNARTDAKRVLQLLIAGQDESRPPRTEELPELCERMLSDLPLLEKRGADCGLANFLDAVRSKLVPLLTGGPTHSQV